MTEPVKNKYRGKVCAKHPELAGLRFKKNCSCIQCHKDRTKARNDRDRPQYLARMRGKANERHAALKSEVLAAYGGVCQRCLESDVDVLTIDHTDGNGAEHRRELSPGGDHRSTGSGVTYRWLKRNAFPPGFRVLCFNCNVKVYLLKLRNVK